MRLYISNRQSELELTKDMENILEQTITEVLKMESDNLNYEISLSLVEDEEIKMINNDFRGIDKITDVLSFPLDFEYEENGNILLGDIIISTNKVLEQSKDFGHSFERELSYLTCHSMLHLFGYDHIDEEDKKVMRKKEEEVMDRLNISR